MACTLNREVMDRQKNTKNMTCENGVQLVVLAREHSTSLCKANKHSFVFTIFTASRARKTIAKIKQANIVFLML